MSTITKVFEKQEVRIITRDSQSWFVAADVCKILEHSNSRQAIIDLEDDEKMTVSNADGHSGKRGGAQSYSIISESGLYALIFKSRKPQAKAFRKWVTSKVLPEIRQTGGYAVEPIPTSHAVEGSFFSLFDGLAKRGVNVDQCARTAGQVFQQGVQGYEMARPITTQPVNPPMPQETTMPATEAIRRPKAHLNITVDPAVMRDAKIITQKLGISLSAFVEQFLRREVEAFKRKKRQLALTAEH